MQKLALELEVLDSKLENNFVLQIIKRVEVNQSINLSEPNRRSLNLLLDLIHRQRTTKLLLNACIFRKESRGGHYRVDFPSKSNIWECHTRQQKNRKIQKRFIKN